MVRRVLLAILLVLTFSVAADAYTLTLLPDTWMDFTTCGGVLEITVLSAANDQYVLGGLEAGCGGYQHPATGVIGPDGSGQLVIVRYEYTLDFTHTPPLVPAASYPVTVTLTTDRWSDSLGHHGPVRWEP